MYRGRNGSQLMLQTLKGFIAPFMKYAVLVHMFVVVYLLLIVSFSLCSVKQKSVCFKFPEYILKNSHDFVTASVYIHTTFVCNIWVPYSFDTVYSCRLKPTFRNLVVQNIRSKFTLQLLGYGQVQSDTRFQTFPFCNFYWPNPAVSPLLPCG